MIAVIGAMKRETEPIIDGLENVKKKSASGIELISGTRKGEKILVATVGIGLVNAASGTQRIIDSHPEIDDIIVSGICGGLNPMLAIGDVIVSNQLLYADATRSAIAESAPYMQRFIPSKKLRDYAEQSLLEIGYTCLDTAIDSVEHDDNERIGGHGEHLSKMKIGEKLDKLGKHTYLIGSIASGNRFVTGDDRTEIIAGTHADGVEMEGAAIAHVVEKNTVDKPRRYVVIKTVSDMCGNEIYCSDDWISDTQPSVDIAARIALGTIDRIIACEHESNGVYDANAHAGLWEHWFERRTKHAMEDARLRGFGSFDDPLAD